MPKEAMGSPSPSSVEWEGLETFARSQVQTFIQRLLEEEVKELLGREKSERREGILLLIAIGLMSESLLILGWVAMGFVLLLAIVIPHEERELTRRFGSEYEQYRMRTGTLLPKLLK